MDRAEQLWNQLLTPLPQGGMADALVSEDPFERAAYRTRQGARPIGGRQEGPLTQSLSDPATAFNASPFGAARDALTAANEGDYGRAAMSAAPLVAPIAGPIVRGAGALMRANPATTGLAAGLSAYLGSADAADRDPKSGEWWRTPRGTPTVQKFAEPTLTPEEERRYIAPEIQGFDKLGPRGKLEATARRDALQKSLIQDRERALADKTKRARADWDEANQRTQAEYEAQQSRLDAEDDKYRLANQSFRDAHPLASPIIQGAGAATALTFPLIARGLTRRANNTMASQLQEAMTAGEAASALPRSGVGSAGSAAARVGAAQRLESAIGPQGVGRMQDTSVSLPGQAAWALGGGAEGAIGATAPYGVDLETLPIGSPGREEASEPSNWGMRAASGFLPGAAMGLIGSRVPMGRGAVPDIARAEGLIKGLKSRAKDATPATSVVASPAKPKVQRRRKKEPQPETE